MSIRLPRAWQMKQRGVIPSIESVILAFQFLVSAFVVPVENAGEPHAEPPTDIVKQCLPPLAFR